MSGGIKFVGQRIPVFEILFIRQIGALLIISPIVLRQPIKTFKTKFLKRPEALDLVQTDHVGAADGRGDPPEVEPVVPAPGILGVVSHDLHGRIFPSFAPPRPARRTD